MKGKGDGGEKRKGEKVKKKWLRGSKRREERKRAKEGGRLRKEKREVERGRS